MGVWRYNQHMSVFVPVSSVLPTICTRIFCYAVEKKIGSTLWIWVVLWKGQNYLKMGWQKNLAKFFKPFFCQKFLKFSLRILVQVPPFRLVCNKCLLSTRWPAAHAPWLSLSTSRLTSAYSSLIPSPPSTSHRSSSPLVLKVRQLSPIYSSTSSLSAK